MRRSYAARNLIDTVPAISVFLKLRLHGKRYMKEFADRIVITWDLSEPARDIEDFTWTSTVNRCQAVLRENGSVAVPRGGRILLSLRSLVNCEARAWLAAIASNRSTI